MPNAVYFPDGGPVSKQVAHSPVSQYDEPNAIQAQEAPDPIRQSDEQGIGRSPGQQWPHMRHTEQFNFASLAGAGWSGSEGAREDQNVNRAARQGWSAPVYYEQRGQHYLWPAPVSVDQAPSQAYTTLVNLGAR
jgi:hypothetical protein